MKRKVFLKIITGILLVSLILKFSILLFFDPWIGNKIQSRINKMSANFRVEIGTVQILLFSSGIELKNIIVSRNNDILSDEYFRGSIGSVKFTGINLFKALFRNEYEVNELSISDCSIVGKMQFLENKLPLPAASFSFNINQINIVNADLRLEDSFTSKSYLVKEGMLCVYNLQLEKRDTISRDLFKKFDFSAAELASVSPDSLYTYAGKGIDYSFSTKMLAVKSFVIHPNYTNYDFAARSKYQTDCIECDFKDLSFNDFEAANFFIAGNVESSFIKIGTMELSVFRDKRREFPHLKKVVFQEMIYNYPGKLHVDSIRLISGNITYTEHAERATESGSLFFNEVHASLYNVTNDTIYKTQNAYLKLSANALLMGKGDISIVLNSRIYDSYNMFSLNGTLSAMEAGELNLFLEKNSFLYITSGTIDKMDFNFIANDSKATGKLTMIYRGLNVEFKGKPKEGRFGLKDRFISVVLRRKVLNSNTVQNGKVRVGTIDYKRDPERFLFSYCAKSILTGIKHSLIKSPNKQK
jgi:hypothetical protein